MKDRKRNSRSIENKMHGGRGVRTLGENQKRCCAFKGHTEQLNLLQMETNKVGMQEEEDASQS